MAHPKCYQGRLSRWFWVPNHLVYPSLFANNQSTSLNQSRQYNRILYRSLPSSSFFCNHYNKTRVKTKHSLLDINFQHQQSMFEYIKHTNTKLVRISPEIVPVCPTCTKSDHGVKTVSLKVQ